ncbi:hypothetical protein GCM10009552_32810 [Rothia nasimurium]|uniref:DUF2188 domain-containing protein n=1 Tax=Luteibacter anthropi TaxID=564369 RepID=A0A7X5UD06_9GAMM|nr:hypothetical protein [Luteibacter anthropi]NII08127.1 hypothetical protein [Luteibacter anthropi]
MPRHTIEYHIADMDGSWGIFREGVQIAARTDAADAIAFANFFADRETLIAAHPVRVSADVYLHRELRRMRNAA